MVRRALRSRSFRRVKVKTHSGKYVTHYIKKKPGHARCANCGSQLHGVASGRAGKMKKLSKTEKRPERPYGGNLCSKCMREAIKIKTLYR